MSAAQKTGRDWSRPCDNCRRRKRRCDGPLRPDRVCTRCTEQRKSCSYTGIFDRAPTVPKAYIAALEYRLNAVEQLLRQHVPEALLMQELGTLAMNVAPSASISLDGDKEPLPEVAIGQHLEDVITLSFQPDVAGDVAPIIHRRAGFWTVPTCEFRGERLEDRRFEPVLPPPEQMAPLVQAYFETWNRVLPVFHRALFEQQLLTVHVTRDKHFIAALLLVCALGEGRLALEKQGYTDQERPGWKYFTQVEPFLRIPPPAEPQLLDVQIYYLAAGFMSFHRGNSAFWQLLGTAVELAFQAHAHQRSAYREQHPKLQDELWKRIFWSLVLTDRTTAYLYGRPLLIKDESFDLELPLDVDDARWDLSTPGYPLCGPPIGTYGSCSFFIWHTRLALILGLSVQTLYSNNRSRLLMGFVGTDWEQRIINRLDELLDEWVTNVPTYLAWDPDATDLGRFVECSLLHAKYYCLKIMAHNPFVRATARDFSRTSHLSATGLDPQTSLEICTQAALKCSEIMTVVIERYPRCLALPGWVDPPFVCGLVLLVNLFGLKEHLPVNEVTRYLTYVRVCLHMLQTISPGQKTAIQRWETLKELVSGLERELQPSAFPTPVSSASRPRSHPSDRWLENPTAPFSPGIPPGLSPQTFPFAHSPALTPLHRPKEAPTHTSASCPSNLSHPLNINDLPLDLRHQMSTGLKLRTISYSALDAGDTHVQLGAQPTEPRAYY
ncbi:fungal-specific transcription factor domain-containing protein [Auriculariales sp. MPI-PUGE-AT-0066]|nr:fungal-specific transcription factor domain-containing protein [Auriculariales sp. MPI-PUGE-AT-0066]